MTPDTPDPRRPDAVVVYRRLQQGPAEAAQLAALFLPVDLDPLLPATTIKAIHQRAYARAFDSVHFLRDHGVAIFLKPLFPAHSQFELR